MSKIYFGSEVPFGPKLPNLRLLSHYRSPVPTVAHAASAIDIADRLYEPTTDPISVLLPRQNASFQIVEFSLKTLGWLHCAVDSDKFLEEHDQFWQSVQFGVRLERERRPWLTLYLSLLAVGILYLDPDDFPDIADLPQICLPLDSSVNIAVNASRIWYETALKEVERFGFSGVPSLPVVQALSVLTLCHINFGESQREWLFTAFATNVARCLDMHKLGTEATVSYEMRQRQEWLTPSQRELGRRLWWSCVIRDWLGSWSRPPSILPASFCCQFSTQDISDDSSLPGAHIPASSSSVDTTTLNSPSQVHFLSTLSRLAYIFYLYIKANAHQTQPKLTKAIEEIQNARKNLPLHLSQHFPVTESDRQWEIEHPWVPFQRYLVTYVLDFIELGVARVLVSKETEDTARFRKLAITLANRILRNYAASVPRVYRLVWAVSAAMVAASVYVSLDILANPHEYRGDVKTETIELLRFASLELGKHAAVAVHAAKGSTLIDSLLPVISQDYTATSQPSRTVHDLLQQLSPTVQNTSDYSDLNTQGDPSMDLGNYDPTNIVSQQGSLFEFGIDEWDASLLGL
ncbi:hypothetical protein GQ44DRAFT_776729 [Phaeosphaeriaceae sp. PMI808]|nr:hypothetical protein GQ44DRAFT_776729 [Phaeosphaeriaceae sp. PMI808]